MSRKPTTRKPPATQQQAVEGKKSNSLSRGGGRGKFRTSSHRESASTCGSARRGQSFFEALPYSGGAQILSLRLLNLRTQLHSPFANAERLRHAIICRCGRAALWLAAQRRRRLCAVRQRRRQKAARRPLVKVACVCVEGDSRRRRARRGPDGAAPFLHALGRRN